MPAKRVSVYDYYFAAGLYRYDFNSLLNHVVIILFKPAVISPFPILFPFAINPSENHKILHDFNQRLRRFIFDRIKTTLISK